MYYGGFAIAIALFILVVLFFIIFKVPSIHRYFKENNRKGLIDAEAISEELKAKSKGPKRITIEEFNNLTEIITIDSEDTSNNEKIRMDNLNNEQKNNKSLDSYNNEKSLTEILD
jgi:hypothetical protein